MGTSWFFAHRWTKWSLVAEGSMRTYLLDRPANDQHEIPSVITGALFLQQRECEQCGFKQWKKSRPC